MPRPFDSEGKIVFGTCRRCHGVLPARGRKLCDYCAPARKPKPKATSAGVEVKAHRGRPESAPRVVAPASVAPPQPPRRPLRANTGYPPAPPAPPRIVVAPPPPPVDTAPTPPPPARDVRPPAPPRVASPPRPPVPQGRQERQRFPWAGLLAFGLGAVFLAAAVSSSSRPEASGAASAGRTGRIGGEPSRGTTTARPPVHPKVTPSRAAEKSLGGRVADRRGVVRSDRITEEARPTPPVQRERSESTALTPDAERVVQVRRSERLDVIADAWDTGATPPRPVSQPRFPEVLRRLLAPWSKATVTVTVQVDEAGEPRVLSVRADCPLSDFARARFEESVTRMRWRPARTADGRTEAAGTAVVFVVP